MDTFEHDLLDTEDTTSTKKEKKPRNRRKRDIDARRTAAVTTAFSDGGLGEEASVRRQVRHGTWYKDFRIDGQAKAHVGDSYNEINIASVTNLQLRPDPAPDRSEEVETVWVAVRVFAIAYFVTAVHLFKMLQRIMSRVALPKQLTRRIARLEDALGFPLDVNIDIMDWTYLHYRILCAFSGKPGYQRVARASYRLFDQDRRDLLIDPRRAPSFDVFFRSGRCYQMSIHFDSTEVSYDKCPKCKFVQDCNIGSETICVRCGFSYRGHVEDNRVEELDDDTEAGDSNTNPGCGGADSLRKITRRAFPRKKRDEPGRFKRISISKERYAYRE